MARRFFGGRHRQKEQILAFAFMEVPRIPSSLAMWYLVGDLGTGGLMRIALPLLDKVLL